MTRTLPVICLLLLASPAKADSADFDGTVRPLTKVLTEKGAQPDADTGGVALVTAEGTVYALVKDDVSRLLFMDPQLHGRDVRLTATLLPGTHVLKVEKVRTVKDGRLFDVDYWCENCQLAASQPGRCICCGGGTNLRERLVKSDQ